MLVKLFIVNHGIEWKLYYDRNDGYEMQMIYMA